MQQRSCGHENAVSDVAGVDRGARVAVDGVANGRFDAVGADDEVSCVSLAEGCGYGGLLEVVGYDFGLSKDRDAGLCAGGVE